MLYIGAENDVKSLFLAININTGKPVFSQETGSSIYCSPVFYNGLIYVIPNGGYMYVVRQNGDMVARIAINEDVVLSSPVIDIKK